MEFHRGSLRKGVAREHERRTAPLAGIDRSTPELNRAFLRAAVFADRAFLERIVKAV